MSAMVGPFRTVANPAFGLVIHSSGTGGHGQ